MYLENQVVPQVFRRKPNVYDFNKEPNVCLYILAVKCFKKNLPK